MSENTGRNSILVGGVGAVVAALVLFGREEKGKNGAKPGKKPKGGKAPELRPTGEFGYYADADCGFLSIQDREKYEKIVKLEYVDLVDDSVTKNIEYSNPVQITNDIMNKIAPGCPVIGEDPGDPRTLETLVKTYEIISAQSKVDGWFTNKDELASEDVASYVKWRDQYLSRYYPVQPEGSVVSIFRNGEIYLPGPKFVVEQFLEPLNQKLSDLDPEIWGWTVDKTKNFDKWIDQPTIDQVCFLASPCFDWLDEWGKDTAFNREYLQSLNLYQGVRDMVFAIAIQNIEFIQDGKIVAYEDLEPTDALANFKTAVSAMSDAYVIAKQAAPDSPVGRGGIASVLQGRSDLVSPVCGLSKVPKPKEFAEKENRSQVAGCLILQQLGLKR